MSIFNKIKSAVGASKKEPEKKQVKPKTSKKPKKEVSKAPVVKQPKVVEPIKTAPPVKKRTPKDAYKILREPHISEKATYLAEANKYIFKVFDIANKIQIKTAVSELYGVRVRDVRIINIKSKSKKIRNVSGHKSGYKKAIVTLEKGQKIEILPH
jgi:large subunit ribosomal protein L23